MNIHDFHKKLTKAFPKDTLVKVISVTEEGRKYLTPKMRWVYSAMIWRRDKGKLLLWSKREMALWTGIDRTRTLPGVLSSLIKFGLVEQHGRKFKAVLPKAGERDKGWFAHYFVKDKKKLAHNWAVYQPGRDVLDGLVQARDAIEKNSASRLAIFFGVDRKTITAARKRLKGLNQVPVPVYNAVKEPEPTPDTEDEMQLTLIVNDNRTFTADFLSLAGERFEGKSDGVSPLLTRLATHYKISEQDTYNQLHKLIAGLVERKKTDKEIFQTVHKLVEKFGNGVELADHICGSAV